MLADGRAGNCFVVLLTVILVSGCSSTPSTPSTRLASVIIKDHPITQIDAVTQSVFREHGFQVARQEPGEIVFEKEGSNMDTMVYGDWSEKKVWVRVKAFLRLMRPTNDVLLDCDAYMVIDLGSPHFEEPHKLTKVHRKRYQELLDEVSRRLN
jgi:hypothetical protein